MTDETRVLAVSGLGYRYGERTVLDGLTFELRRGEILTLIGPNGSGKSTLLKLMAGLVPRSERAMSGTVRVMEKDVADYDVRALARTITYVGPDLGGDFPILAEDVVLMGRICHADSRTDRVEEGMALCQASHLRGREVDTLSGGERQLISLARAITQESSVVLLDEALSRMDLHHQAAIGALLRRLAAERGLSFVLVSHDLNVAAEWSDRCVLLKDGKITAEGMTETTLRTDVLRELYPNASVQVAPNPFTGKPNVFFGAPDGAPELQK